MPGFITIVTTLVLVSHCYIFWRLRAAFKGGWWQLPVLLFFAFMIAIVYYSRNPLPMPLSGMLSLIHSARPAPMPLPEPLSGIGYLWLGCILVSCSAFFCIDMLRLLLFFAAKITTKASGGITILTAKRAGLLALALSCGFCVYAYWRAMTPAPVYLTIPSAKIAPGTAPLRIVAVSDIHLSDVIGPERLERLTTTIAAQNPDILVLLGDIVDSDMRGKTIEADLLRGVVPKGGAFAVLGNHEAYRGQDQAMDFLRRAGVTLLRNTSVTVRGITIVGVDDAAQGSSIPREKALLQRQSSSRFTLFLRHRPGNQASLAGLCDLQLSGHTHAGQIWPGRLIVGRIHGVAQGLSEITGPAGQSLLYVLNGAGFWGPPMRLGATPDVLVIDLAAG